MEAAGWSQAETARQLEISTGGINQICKGHVRPSGVTLRLMRLLSASNSKSGDRIPPYAVDVVRELGAVEPSLRDLAGRAALGAISSFPKAAPPKRRLVEPAISSGKGGGMTEDEKRRLAEHVALAAGQDPGASRRSSSESGGQTADTLQASPQAPRGFSRASKVPRRVPGEHGNPATSG